MPMQWLKIKWLDQMGVRSVDASSSTVKCSDKVLTQTVLLHLVPLRKNSKKCDRQVGEMWKQ